MVTPEEQKARYLSLSRTVNAISGRENWALGEEEFEEIGYLTIRMTALEESLALFCELLLTRPELGGFHPINKPVLRKQFSEKIGLLKALVVAIGTLYGIDIQAMQKSLLAIGDLGEDRNTIVHGLLTRGGDGAIVFQNRERDVRGGTAGLRELTDRFQAEAAVLITNFGVFYAALGEKKSITEMIDVAVPNALDQILKMHISLNHARELVLKIREEKVKLLHKVREAEAMRLKLIESKKALLDAKRKLRNARAQERRRSKRAEQEKLP